MKISQTLQLNNKEDNLKVPKVRQNLKFFDNISLRRVFSLSNMTDFAKSYPTTSPNFRRKSLRSKNPTKGPLKVYYKYQNNVFDRKNLKLHQLTEPSNRKLFCKILSYKLNTSATSY